MCHVLWPNNNNFTIAYHATARSITHHSIVGDSFGKKRRYEVDPKRAASPSNVDLAVLNPVQHVAYQRSVLPHLTQHIQLVKSQI